MYVHACMCMSVCTYVCLHVRMSMWQDLNACSMWSSPVGVDQIGWRTSVSLLHGAKLGLTDFVDPDFSNPQFSHVFRSVKSEMMFGLGIDIGPGKFRRSVVSAGTTAGCLSFGPVETILCFL